LTSSAEWSSGSRHTCGVTSLTGVVSAGGHPQQQGRRCESGNCFVHGYSFSLTLSSAPWVLCLEQQKESFTDSSTALNAGPGFRDPRPTGDPSESGHTNRLTYGSHCRRPTGAAKWLGFPG
jgi:hypothetical protein